MFVSGRLGRKAGISANVVDHGGRSQTNKDIQQIITAMNDARRNLKSDSLSKVMDEENLVPEFVVMGMQSTGKSRLIETIAGQRFNYVYGDTATMRPTHIYFKNDMDILPHGRIQWALKEKQADGSMEYVDYDLETLQSKLSKLHEIDLVDENEIELRCSSSNQYDLDLIDLPGKMYPDSDAKQADKDNLQAIDDLMKKYMQRKNSRIMLVDEIRDVANIGIIQETVGQWLTPDQYSKVTYVRTKLDVENLDQKKSVNDFMKCIDQDGTYRVKDGMKWVSLSCPHFDDDGAEDGENEKLPDDEFQKLIADRNSKDLHKVAEAQYRVREKEEGRGAKRNAEDDEVLSKIGFENFIRIFQKDVKAEFTKNLIPVANQMTFARNHLESEIEKNHEKLVSEKEKGGGERTGEYFADAVSMILSSNIGVKENVEGSNTKKTLVCPSLATDAAKFCEKLSFETVFPEKDRMAELRGADVYIRDQVQMKTELNHLKLKETERFEKLKLSCGSHKEKIDAEDKAKKDRKDPTEFNNAQDKYNKVVEDLTRYMFSADPGFTVELAKENMGAYTDGEGITAAESRVTQRKMVVEKMISNAGYLSLKGHLKIVALRMKQVLKELLNRARVFMTNTISGASPVDPASILVGIQKDDFLNAGLHRSEVVDSVGDQYEKYLDMLVDKFMIAQVKRLDTMLLNPHSLLITSQQLPNVLQLDYTPPTYTNYDEAKTVAHNDLYRQEALQDKIKEFYTATVEVDGEKVDRFGGSGPEEGALAHVQMATLLYKYARKRIAEDLHIYLKNFFFNRLVSGRGAFGNQNLKEIGEFKDFMNEMNKDCFQVDKAALAELEEKESKLKKELSDVNKTLGSLEKLKPIVDGMLDDEL